MNRPRISCGLAIAVAVALLVAQPQVLCGQAPSPPKWPAAFEMSYTLSLPYVSSIQPGGLQIPTHVWYDARGGSQLLRVGVYNGLDDLYVLPGVMYNVFPRISTRTCTAVNTSVGPTGLGNSGALPPPLPDLSGWTYGGQGSLQGKGPSHIWQLTERWWDKVNTYTFYTAQRDGRPLALSMIGVNVFSGSHYDHYAVDFTYFAPLAAPLVLSPPKICKLAAPGASAGSQGLTAQSLSLLPGYLAPAAAANTSASPPSTAAATGGAEGGPLTAALAALTSWASRLQHTITHAIARPEAAQQQQGAGSSSSVTAANLAYIERWNREVAARAGAAASNAEGAVRDGFKLGAGRWVSVSDGVWRATALGRAPGPSPTKRASALGGGQVRGRAYLGTYARVLRDDQLPEAVDWRGTGADGPVKDQASCGSCWAFATTGAMTGAWFLATGQSLSFSEQQIVDCAWDHGPNGCSGGWMEPALDYVAEAGGGRTEGSYPYLGANGFCRHNTTSKAGAFKGWREVPPKDEAALMEVLALHGPVAISFDAVHPTFKYYSEGVYYRADCGTDEDSLNHAVLLVGYGTTPAGTDYWLLRNSWSSYWGDGGYFKLARKGNDCGITVDPVLAVVDERAAAQAMTAAGRAAVEAARARAITPRQKLQLDAAASR
uniref:Peptidase C1A papain C-terminal domain-containing protein n=1 Tax=Chlamydomonas leiostraca TaxID=1034604 RepID=A0A7S0RNP8_9CHLO|mmetsp:Transcript_27081/g.68843  ORF Transcript_27081/g.68843 Transcript_27081/m.68843 type:complete len:659 (+) Transcript_27081:76-2052(+)|eukprot:CAMPEP_0202867172 /NCGR_PEP_ID=MMETSP1391-20130828/8859_1 /ASSEMBLY_ACC=CAM_ASM_000867 /TAXON_ID=1034604 /ORGANISM="Chlamydomonas leiostraca, Strain SAG 11-49" /LENGTH=658 /DNA_ID=CAMNT_0049547187 /DNA_START=77 /DNA_END=2053 /DNA_ORIENTATION=+